jgi:chaperone modulatory protein CbpM
LDASNALFQQLKRLSMPNNALISGVIIEHSQALTLEEFCHATHVSREIIIELIDYQLLHPTGQSPDEWRFDSISLKRGRLAASFLRDLEVNMPGVALAMDLMDRIEQLQHIIVERGEG